MHNMFRDKSGLNQTIYCSLKSNLCTLNITNDKVAQPGSGAKKKKKKTSFLIQFLPHDYHVYDDQKVMALNFNTVRDDVISQ